MGAEKRRPPESNLQSKPDTHTHQWQKQTRHRRKGKQKLCRLQGEWRPLESRREPAGAQMSSEPTPHGRPSPGLSPQAALMPPGPGQRDQNGQQLRTGSSDIPPPRPRRAGSAPVRSCRLLSSRGLASNPPQPGLSPGPLPALPCGEQTLPCQGHLGEVRGETSAVKSCG